MENIITRLSELSNNDAEILTRLSFQLGYETDINQLSIRTQEIINNSNQVIFVATADDKIVGFIHVFSAVRVETPIFIEIAALVIDENYRKKNIARDLINAAIMWGNSNGITKVVVRCNVIRKETHQFYTRLGFMQEKEQKIFTIVDPRLG